MPRNLPLLQSEGDVLSQRHVGPEGVTLKNHRCFPLVGRQGGDVLTLEENRPRGGLFQTRDASQKRRLAATTSSEQEEQFTRLNPDTDPVEGADLAEILDD